MTESVDDWHRVIALGIRGAVLTVLILIITGCGGYGPRPYLLPDAEHKQLSALVGHLSRKPAPAEQLRIDEEMHRLKASCQNQETIQLALQALCFHKDAEVRLLGLRYLDPPWIDDPFPYFNLLRDPDPRVRTAALTRVLKNGRTYFIDALQLALDDSDAGVRKLAVYEALLQKPMHPSLIARSIRLLPEAERTLFQERPHGFLRVYGSLLTAMAGPYPIDASTYLNAPDRAKFRADFINRCRIWLDNNEAALNRFAQWNDFSHNPHPGIWVTLEAPACFLRPGAAMPLTLVLHNFQNQPVSIPSGTSIEFFARRPSRDLPIPYVKRILLQETLIIPAFESKSFRAVSNELKLVRMGKSEVLGAGSGYYDVRAIGRFGPSQRARGNTIFGSNRLRLNFNANSESEARKWVQRSLTSSKADVREARRIARWFPPGTSKALLDKVLTIEGRPSTSRTLNGVLQVRYPFDWTSYVQATYEPLPNDKWALKEPLAIHFSPRPPPPKEVDLKDWLLAHDGVYLRIDASAPAFAAGTPAEIEITLGNVDVVPRTVPVPLTRYSQNTLLSLAICSDRQRWNEWTEPPSHEFNAQRTLKMKRRRHWPRLYSYSFPSLDGKLFFISERAHLITSALRGDRLAATGKDWRLVTLKPGEVTRFRTTLGGLSARLPTGHATRADTWRLRLFMSIRASPAALASSPHPLVTGLTSNTITVTFSKLEGVLPTPER